MAAPQGSFLMISSSTVLYVWFVHIIAFASLITFLIKGLLIHLSLSVCDFLDSFAGTGTLLHNRVPILKYR